MKKVFVGISGGVDSSVSALLLKEQGCNVTGVFIKVWYPDFITCNWRSEMQDAMRVCAKLDIPFLICDAEKEYKEGVIDYMIHEYQSGRTPNPDVMCNKQVKFKSFLDFAVEHDADHIATGHYAQNKDGLFKAVDNTKDQTYFLWNLNKEILGKVLFPIGHLRKEEVRNIAKKYGLFTASKKDSQGLCFLGHVEMKDFLRHYLRTEVGDVLNERGEVIGRHEGAILYTIGERHSFEIFQQTVDEKPLFVIDKDLDNNTITVSLDRVVYSAKDSVFIKDTNFIKDVPVIGKKLQAKIRYRQPNQDCVVMEKNKNMMQLKFLKPQVAITPGQSVVLYDNLKCVGGGIIS